MILVIGGAYQYKLEFTHEILKGKKVNLKQIRICNGAVDELELIMKSDVVYQFHLYVKRMMELDMDVAAVIERLAVENPDAIVILDEIGSGIVPVTAEDRAYREAVGAAGALLVSHAEAVYRVFCGIGTRIK